MATFEQVEKQVHFAGTGSEYLQLLRDAMQAELTQGRFLTEEDEQSSAQVVVLDEVLASTLFPQGQPVGRNIRIGNRSLSVVGVVRTPRYPYFDDVRRDAYIPFSAFDAEGLFLERPTQAELDRIWVKVMTQEHLNGTQEIIKKLISQQHPGVRFSIR
jgi:putative ABC transport system permease protein